MDAGAEGAGARNVTAFGGAVELEDPAAKVSLHLRLQFALEMLCVREDRCESDIGQHTLAVMSDHHLEGRWLYLKIGGLGRGECLDQVAGRTCVGKLDSLACGNELPE